MQPLPVGRTIPGSFRLHVRRSPKSSSSSAIFSRLLGLSLFFVNALFSHVVLAQDDVPEVTRAYAIVGATVIPAPGQVLENGTVIIRDGVITALGQNIAIPADAHLMRVDSMYVYAGFIDGLTHAGIAEPKEENPGRPDDPGNPGFERSGVQPDKSAAELVDPEEKSVTAHREAGFASANIVPWGRMLPGTSVVATMDEAGPRFLKKNAALYAQFSGARGAYPGTPVGVMAYFRQLYRESQRQQAWTTAYASNPTNMEPPPGESVYEAFFPVIDKAQPVVFHANSVLEVQRAIRLQNELDFRLVLAGVSEAAEMIELLADSGFPVIMSVKLPKEDKKEDKKGAKADSAKAMPDSTRTGEKMPDAMADSVTAAMYNAAFISESEADMDDERKNLLARRAATRQRYLEAGAALEKAGVAFGFTGIDVKPGEILPNVRKMVDAGLSGDAALAALTVNNARILGVDRNMGTIEPGKIANVVVATAPLFAKEAKLKYVFVNGHPTELDVSKKK